MPQRVKDSEIPIEAWGELKNIYVESEEMVSELQYMVFTKSEAFKKF